MPGGPDKDHIFPFSKCTESQFTRVGVHKDDCASLIAMADRLPNLQLLRHDDNIKGSKGVNLPKD
jgi:hypothetical protein